MNVLQNHSLLKLNTFGIDATAARFIQFDSIEDLKNIFKNSEYTREEKLILGGGSNILFTKNYNGLILKNNIKGIEILKEDEMHAWVRAGAGEVWHELVLFCIAKNLGGIENLSLIPGTVGASPIQNIGAYGVEIKDVFDQLEAFSIHSNNIQVFHNSECEFGYRESIFKKKRKGEFIITSVTFRLNKNPQLNVSYGAIKETLQQQGIEQPTIKSISDAVIKIRKSKLPDPAELGNAGSFFKNPQINEQHYLQLKSKYPEIPSYPVSEGQMKIPAGWLIEQCGWKGKVVGKAGVHKNQALVIVNYGGATGKEIEALSESIKHSVASKYNIQLETEVNII